MEKGGRRESEGDVITEYSSERGNGAGSEDGKSGQEPRNVHSLWKLEKAKKWILS